MYYTLLQLGSHSNIIYGYIQEKKKAISIIITIITPYLSHHSV